MSGIEFAPLVAVLLSFAPPNWTAMRVTYRYDNALAVADTETYAISAGSKDWVRVGHSGFKLMDFFDAYRERVHPKMERPWTTIAVTVRRENQEPVVEFGYEPANILQR